MNNSTFYTIISIIQIVLVPLVEAIYHIFKDFEELKNYLFLLAYILCFGIIILVILCKNSIEFDKIGWICISIISNFVLFISAFQQWLLINEKTSQSQAIVIINSLSSHIIVFIIYLLLLGFSELMIKFNIITRIILYKRRLSKKIFRSP
jgi:hypothetical protein